MTLVAMIFLNVGSPWEKNNKILGLYNKNICTNPVQHSCNKYGDGVQREEDMSKVMSFTVKSFNHRSTGVC